MIWTVNIGIIMSSAGDEWNLSEVEKGIIGSCFMVGMLIGSYTWGVLADKRGRMFAFKNTIICAGIATLVLTFSVNFYMLCVMVVVLGAGVGGEICVGGVVFQEFCPPSKQWALALLAACWCLGGTLAALIAVVVEFTSPPYQLWRWLCGIGVLIQVVYWLIRRKNPETPRFLFLSSEFELAEALLQQMANTNGKNIRVKIDINQAKEVCESQNNLKKSLIEKTENSSIMREIWTNYLGVTVALLMVYFCLNFGSTGINIFMPELLKESGGEVKGVMLYMTIVIQQAAGIPGVFVSTKLVESRLGRKITLIFSVVVTGLFAFLFLVARSYALILTFTSLSSFFNYITFSCLYLITPESYHTEVRNTGVGIANSSAKLGGLIAPLLTGFMLDIKDGFSITLIAMSVMYWGSGLSALMLKETRGRSLDAK
mmetsp:Transcript_9544/g.14216  ORF Transcript_9544/g.14216 Transcript_9544/m.14216 type:complete len:428 (+) Transcript_9544:143-1426(+)